MLVVHHQVPKLALQTTRSIQNQQPMLRLAIIYKQFRGHASHFAHFVCEFIIPLYAYLRRTGLLALLDAGLEIRIELPSAVRRLQLGRFAAFVHEAFPTLSFDYVDRFSVPPISIISPLWLNDRTDVEEFTRYLRSRFSIYDSPFGVVLMERVHGTIGAGPGIPYVQKTGADRRAIASGFSELVAAVKAVRKDTLAVALEELSFVDQLSVCMAADTLIGQHGAGFAHAHWMLPEGHLIELQCREHPDCPGFTCSIARIRQLRHSVVRYPCSRIAGRPIEMAIPDPALVTALISTRPCK